MIRKQNMIQNDVIQLKLTGQRDQVAAAQTAAATVAGGVFIMEATVNEVDWVTPITMLDPVTKGPVTNLTGPNKSGWAELPGYAQVRMKRTDATGGVGDCALSAPEI